MRLKALNCCHNESMYREFRLSVYKQALRNFSTTLQGTAYMEPTILDYTIAIEYTNFSPSTIHIYALAHTVGLGVILSVRK